MKNKNQGKSGIKRRKLLPFLGSLLVLPFIGSARSVANLAEEVSPDYQTMLTKEGKAVRVRKRTVNNSKVVDKQLSNKSLLEWLRKNDTKG